MAETQKPQMRQAIKEIFEKLDYPKTDADIDEIYRNLNELTRRHVQYENPRLTLTQLETAISSALVKDQESSAPLLGDWERKAFARSVPLLAAKLMADINTQLPVPQLG